MTDSITIDATKTFEENLQMNGLPNEQYIIGQLEEMTLRSGKTYATPGQSGGALHPIAKAILVAAFGILAAGSLLGGTYTHFVSQLCTPGTISHMISLVPVYGAPQAEFCNVISTQFTVAMALAIPIAAEILRRTKNKVSSFILSAEQEAQLNGAVANLQSAIPQAVADNRQANQRAGSKSRRLRKKQQSRQKK